MSTTLPHRIKALLTKLNRIHSTSERTPHYLKAHINVLHNNIAYLLNELLKSPPPSPRESIKIENVLINLDRHLNIIEIACDFSKTTNKAFLFFTFKSIKDIYRHINILFHKNKTEIELKTLIFLHPYEEFCERYLRLEESVLEPIRSSLSMIPSTYLDTHIIYIPRTTPNKPSEWPPLIHEIGHTIFQGKSSPILEELLENTLHKITDEATKKSLLSYIEETICDLIASAYLGPAYTLKLLEEYKAITAWGREHPPIYIRCEIMKDIYQEITQSKNTEALSDLWNICQNTLQKSLNEIRKIIPENKEKRYFEDIFKEIIRQITEKKLKNILINMTKELNNLIEAYIKEKEETQNINLLTRLKEISQEQKTLNKTVDKLRPFLESTTLNIQVIVALAPIIIHTTNPPYRATINELILDTIKRSIIKQVWLKIDQTSKKQD